MGYYSRWTGEILIGPPIPVAKLGASRYLDESRKHGSDYNVIGFRVERQPVEIKGETFYREVVTAIEPVQEDECSGYYWADQLKEALTLINNLNDFIANGAIVRIGEGQGDVERFWVIDGLHSMQQASLRWPDGTLVET